MVWLLSSCAPNRTVIVTSPASPPQPAAPSAPGTPITTTEEARPEFQRVATQTLRIRVWTGFRQMTLTGAAPVDVYREGVTQRWAAGTYTLRLNGGTPAPRRFHLFVKTFKANESAAAQAYVEGWRQKGENAQLVRLGQRFRTTSGALLDNRVQYVSLVRVGTKAEAEAMKSKLETQGQWSWIEEEVMGPGGGTISVVDGAGHPLETLSTPLRLRSLTPLSVAATLGGKPAEGAFAGVLEVRVGVDGQLDLFETLPIEEYLMGVLPAEMPASWPSQALQAQAVAARSEVLANLGVKHKLEGFNYCAAEHCRAYRGYGGREPSCDGAVKATKGMVLSADRRVAVTVFSANCGGWTEDNDNVWSSPPDPCLRGRADAAQGTRLSPGAMAPGELKTWLQAPPVAYCSDDKTNFRWERRVSAAELTTLVNRSHPVGNVKEIRLGERGVSGRLKSVEIVGSKSSVRILKELPIRQVFGGLPSAMFILEVQGGSSGPSAFVFRGGGRGHGVGLCQHGARGMAAQGRTHAEILSHYFSGATMVRLD